MRAVVQRVKNAHVSSEGNPCGEIEQGLVVFLGVTHSDTEKDAAYLAEKIVNLRIFEDKEGKLNLSVKDISGKIMSISQFTLYGDCRKGRRPGFTEAARPETANELYEKFNAELKNQGVEIATGVFQTEMQVALVNDGPITMLLDSNKLF